MPTAPRAATRDEVPLLDLTPLNEGKPLGGLAREFRRACETIGFFYAGNHGVPRAVVDGVFDATRRYFALPEEKRFGSLRTLEQSPNSRSRSYYINTTLAGDKLITVGHLSDYDRLNQAG